MSQLRRVGNDERCSGCSGLFGVQCFVFGSSEHFRFHGPHGTHGPGPMGAHGPEGPSGYQRAVPSPGPCVHDFDSIFQSNIRPFRALYTSYSRAVPHSCVDVQDSDFILWAGIHQSGACTHRTQICCKPSFQQWISLVWKPFPHPIGVFFTPLGFPNCHAVPKLDVH